MTSPVADPSHVRRFASLGQLLATVGHEVTNPVSCIVANAGVLRERLDRIDEALRRGDLDAARRAVVPARKAAALLSTSADRAAIVVRDLHLLSRPDTDTSLSLRAAIDATVRLLRPRWKDRIEVRCDLSVEIVVHGSVTGIHQILTNLVANACDAVSDRGVVEIGARVCGDTLAITVADDGSGIPEALQRRIFEPYVTTKATGAGTGLGLWITRDLVLGYGGAIEARSRPGETVFTVQLPLVDGSRLRWTPPSGDP
jgi:signal transduction histidine kinase